MFDEVREAAQTIGALWALREIGAALDQSIHRVITVNKIRVIVKKN